MTYLVESYAYLLGDRQSDWLMLRDPFRNGGKGPLKWRDESDAGLITLSMFVANKVG
jgi:hypothetical protein